MTRQDYLHALQCKVAGLAQLHESLLNQSLDFFVILSSFVSLVGNPGQANYAAACTYQDAFARWRTAQGLPTRSLIIGRIEGAGYVHRNPDATKNLQKSGIQEIPLRTFLSLLRYAIYSPPKDAFTAQIAVGWDSSLSRDLDNPMLSHFVAQNPTHPFEEAKCSLASSNKLLQEAVDTTNPHEKRLAQLETAICHYTAHILGIPIEDVNPPRSMSHHGGDSLVVVELRNWLQKDLGAPVAKGKT